MTQSKTIVVFRGKQFPASVEQVDLGEFDKDTGKYIVTAHDGTFAMADTIMEAADAVTAQLNRRR